MSPSWRQVSERAPCRHEAYPREELPAMHRMKRCRRSNPVHAPVLVAALRAGRGEAPLPVRRRRRRLISDQGLAYTVYTYILAGAAIVTSLAVGLVTSQ